MMIMKVFVLIAFISLCDSKTNFMHNLPLVNHQSSLFIYFYITCLLRSRFIIIIHSFLIFLLKNVDLLLLLQGEYRLFLEKFYPCKSNNLIQYNLYLSKETLNTTQLKGNFTFTIPLDDTIIVSTFLIKLYLSIIIA